ncbi:MAG: DUF4184 family protein [Candidatus Hodarchaeales archaeon]|jgi:hypothetical protein
MPFTILSHQAPILFLKLKFPEKFSLSALFFSSVMPDVEAILDKFFPGTNTHLAHSLLGIFFWTLPLTVISVLIFLIFVVLIRNHYPVLQKEVDKQFGYWGSFEKTKEMRILFSKSHLVMISYSAILGGFSHLLLDFPSHGDHFWFLPLGVYLVPEILRISFADFGTFRWLFFEVDLILTVYNIIWLLETFIGGIISIYILDLVYRKKKLNNYQ